MDLYGPVLIKSISGKKFILVIVDDLSRLTGVIFLRKKIHAADEIISFIKQSEVLYDLKVRKLQSDHGTNF